MKTPIFFLINMNSGRIKKELPTIEKAILSELDTNKYQSEIIKTHSLEEAYSALDNITSIPDSIVVAVGGDGTVNKTINRIVNKPVILGIIPLGSGNALARELNISLNINKAITTLNKGKARSIDLMLVNNKYYGACVGGIGFDALIARKFEKLETRGLKNYIRLAVREYFSYQNIEFILKINEKEFRRQAFLLSFANTRQYGNNAFIAPKAVIDDGIIDVVILKKFHISDTPILATKLFTKSIDNSRYIEYFRAEEFEIKVEKSPIFIHLDGESIVEECKTIKVKNIHNHLKVIYES